MCKFLHCLTFILFVLHFIYWSRFLFSYRADFHFRFTESERETLPSMFVVKHSFYVYEESIFYKQFYKHVEQSKQAFYQSAVCKDVLILLNRNHMNTVCDFAMGLERKQMILKP